LIINIYLESYSTGASLFFIYLYMGISTGRERTFVRT